MNEMSVEKIIEECRLASPNSDYLGTVDLALSLVRQPKSLLAQGLQRLNHHPEMLEKELNNFRPISKHLKEPGIPLSPHLSAIVKKLAAEDAENEVGLTLALLDGPNALVYTLYLKGISIDEVKDAVQTAAVSGPVRINTPRLNRYGKDLTHLARQGKLAPCIGRENEIQQVITILQRMNKNMPVIVGEAGVGKTAVVEGLAQFLISDDAPLALRECSIIEFPISGLTADKQFVGQIEGFVEGLIDELRRNPDVILFFDEIHQIIGAGTSKDNKTDVAQQFKPALARSEIKIIGATTQDEYMVLEKDTAFERRMNRVKVEEPSVSLATKMLKGAQGKYETHHQIKIEDGVLESAVNLAKDYLTHRKLPDSAFDLIDLACASMRTFDAGTSLSIQDITRTLAEMTGIDMANVYTSVKDRLSGVQEAIKKQVIGQDAAVKAIMDKLIISYGGLRERKSPVGVFLFMGNPGCGKTLVAKMLAACLFGDEKRLLRLDMGEYTEEHAVNRMIGAPPGYIGHEQGGILTEFLKNNPFSILLFDEVEKAHYRIMDVFLSLFGEGHITDGRGRRMDARNTVCIMTSNQGIEEAQGRHLFLGEVDEEEKNRRLKDSLKRAFRPEFLNRIEVIGFKDLDEDSLKRISRLRLKELDQRLQIFGVRLTADEAVYDLLAEEAAEIESGARTLERMIDERIMFPLSRMRVDGELREGDETRCFVQDNEIKVVKEESK